MTKTETVLYVYGAHYDIHEGKLDDLQERWKGRYVQEQAEIPAL